MKNMVTCLLTVAASALVAAGFNMFLIPHHLLAGGVSGISMIIGYVTDWNISLLYFVLNLPLLVFGWFALGQRFIWISIVSVLTTTYLMQIIPVYNVTKDPILGAVFGGVIIGSGIGVSFRVGGSSGGFDIIGAIVTRKKDFPIGGTLFVLNGVVVLTLGFYYHNWDLALYSLLARYITGRIIDMVYFGNVKVTVFIITGQKDQLLQEIVKLPHGVTIINSEGAYSHTEKSMLMTVTTRYELPELNRIVREIDKNAFVNIVETVGVMGNFIRSR